jgi:short-subunit dehydrogenase
MAVVAGASGGIGRRLAEPFAGGGYSERGWRAGA